MSATVREISSVPQRSKLARVCVWVGTSISGLLIVATILSPWSPRGGIVDRYCYPRLIPIAGGIFVILYHEPAPGMYPIRDVPGWTWYSRSDDRNAWLPKFAWAFGRSPALFIPYWLMLIVVATPTAFLAWRNNRRQRGGCRRCGYDLTGNTSGRCPECGVEIAP